MKSLTNHLIEQKIEGFNLQKNTENYFGLIQKNINSIEKLLSINNLEFNSYSNPEVIEIFKKEFPEMNMLMFGPPSKPNNVKISKIIEELIQSEIYGISHLLARVEQNLKKIV